MGDGRTRVLAPLLCAALSGLVSILTGCATGMMEVRDLGFLQDGRTARAEVLTKLGEPSGSYQQQRFLTYRFGKRAKGGYRTPAGHDHYGPGGTWHMLKYSLVLVFDDGGVLKKHKLVEVN